MTAPSSPTDERECSQPGSTSRLVMHRRVGAGFSLGEDWRFDVLSLTPQFVTLFVSGGSQTARWQLEVDDALEVTLDNTLACSRHSPAGLSPFEVRVVRVTSSHATLLINAARSLRITRHDSVPAHASAA
jgi:sRNA-binding carbon storage regulator CsrA